MRKIIFALVLVTSRALRVESPHVLNGDCVTLRAVKYPAQVMTKNRKYQPIRFKTHPPRPPSIHPRPSSYASNIP